jgi:hypothetical protein
MLSLQFAVAGTLGLPMASVIISAAEALLDWDDDDPRELEAEYRQMLADALGKTGGRIVAKGFIDALTPVSIHGRLTLSDLWFRTSDRDLEGAAYELDVLKAVIGPMASIATGFLAGAGLMKRGHIERGIEQMVPKFVKDPLKALRYTLDDARTMNDIKLKDMAPVEIFSKLIGFASSDLSDLYGQSNAVRNIDSALRDRRASLIERMRDARANSDYSRKRQVQGEINRFNEKNPDRRITLRTIVQSERSRRRMERQMEFGVRKTKRNRDQVDRFDFAE